MNYLVCSILITCLIGCKAIAERPSSPIVIGHRGACGHEPENTLSSLKKALALGVDMIEFDVRLCKSGHVILLHDDTLDRTTNATGYLDEYTIEELDEVSIESTEQIPTLQQAIETIDHRAKIGVELKGPNTALPTAEIIKEYLAKGWRIDDFYIISYDHLQLQQFHKALPQLKRCANICGTMIGLTTYASKHEFDAIGIEYELATQQLVDEAHLFGIKVFVYTVNDPHIIKQMIAMGVDGIFSDYPERVRQIVDAPVRPERGA